MASNIFGVSIRSVSGVGTSSPMPPAAVESWYFSQGVGSKKFFQGEVMGVKICMEFLWIFLIEGHEVMEFPVSKVM